MTLVYFPEGHLVHHASRSETPGNLGLDGLQIINSGSAKVTTPSAGGEIEAVIAILREGDWFGEISLNDGLPPPADVTSISTMECYCLPRAGFLDALSEPTEIAVSMLPRLSRMVRSAGKWISQLL